MGQEEWILNLEDNEWPLTTINHDRMIARAIVYLKADIILG